MLRRMRKRPRRVPLGRAFACPYRRMKALAGDGGPRTVNGMGRGWWARFRMPLPPDESVGRRWGATDREWDGARVVGALSHAPTAG